ncbi:hypothetical protein BSU04_26015 [Caballeronia sordidicola]|uniref:Mobile element protein n=1 Tax=Caballeronia sordidicola TaxID=196367 RepID=A0A226WY46_CABSO|nr:hypothetical protein BSU04_26015 [Caballeronia sordidicola]
MRGPLSNLFPNLHHFSARLEVLRTREATHELLRLRTWRLEGFNNKSV